MVNKPTHINTNINRINRVTSFNNITVNTPITELTCKSTYKSTNELVCEPTHAPIIARCVSTIQATHDANFTVAWSSDYSYRSITLSCGTDLVTNRLKQCVIHRKRLDPAIQYLYVSNCNNNVFCKCGIESDGCCECNIYVDNGLNSECEYNALDTGCNEIFFKSTVITMTELYITNNETNKLREVRLIHQKITNCMRALSALLIAQNLEILLFTPPSRICFQDPAIVGHSKFGYRSVTQLAYCGQTQFACYVQTRGNVSVISALLWSLYCVHGTIIKKYTCNLCIDIMNIKYLSLPATIEASIIQLNSHGKNKNKITNHINNRDICYDSENYNYLVSTTKTRMFVFIKHNSKQKSSKIINSMIEIFVSVNKHTVLNNLNLFSNDLIRLNVVNDDDIATKYYIFEPSVSYNNQITNEKYIVVFVNEIESNIKNVYELYQQPQCTNSNLNLGKIYMIVHTLIYPYIHNLGHSIAICLFLLLYPALIINLIVETFVSVNKNIYIYIDINVYNEYVLLTNIIPAPIFAQTLKSTPIPISEPIIASIHTPIINISSSHIRSPTKTHKKTPISSTNASTVSTTYGPSIAPAPALAI